MAKYDLYSKFDAYEHLKHYPHYLEVGIDPQGEVHYAIPSHQEQLIRECCKKLNCTRAHLESICPPEYYFDYVTWLQSICGWVSVWTQYVKFGSLTQAQIETLRFLKNCGAYEGELPDMEEFI